MKVFIGQLDILGTIKYPVSAQDATYGTPTITWTTLAEVWMNVEDAMPSRAESVKLGLSVATNLTRVRFRKRDDVTSAMRIDIGSRVLQIISGPANIGKRDTYQEVMCDEVTS